LLKQLKLNRHATITLDDSPERSKRSLSLGKTHFQRFYRAMHHSAKRGLAIACRLSVRLSVCDVSES